jgi:tetratricopeptide (TPR) repeat protein
MSADRTYLKWLRDECRRMYRSSSTYAILLLLAIIGFQIGPAIRPMGVDAYQDVSYFLFPSAERAYEYGEIHFSPGDPSDYDIQRAAYYFGEAARNDQSPPYVFHQLARIAFIEGDLPKALVLINEQINIEGDTTPPSYYVRALIEAYQGDYSDSEKDYAHFLQLVPDNWAGVNDYAWVLLKDNKPELAAIVTSSALVQYVDNPWLLNTNATALYELGDVARARIEIQKANAAVANITTAEWSVAYPGNDPGIASLGVSTFKAAVSENMQKIDSATTTILK